MLFYRLSVCVLLMLASTVCVAQDEVKFEFDSKEAKVQRLSYATGHAKALNGKRNSGGGKVLPMDDPLLRWTNPYSDVKDGFLFGWVDEKGIPMAVAQIYLLPSSKTTWGIEFQSLSQDSFSLASETNGPWRPRKPGVTWMRVPGKVAKPASSKPLRLSQMRSLARRFRGNDEFEDEGNTLRLLTNPLFRYEDPSAGLVDGAVFTLVHGTDPEMIISLELRKDPETKESAYHYALAPMTGYELRCEFDGKEVWHKPRMNSNLATDIFWQSNVSDSKRGSVFRLFGF